MSFWLGIDIGTSAVRACLIDNKETQLALTRAPLQEQTPAAWQDAVLQSLNELFKQHDANKVQSIAVDGTSATMLLCDPQGKPLTEALMYNDASCAALANNINAPGNSPALSATAGLPKVIKLAQQINHRPALLQHQSDWISGWLSGNYGDTDENNALKTGYDPQIGEWPNWVKQSLPHNVCLPKVNRPGIKVGHAGKVLTDMGIPTATTIVAGTTDSTAAFLSTGASQLNQGITTLGSTLVIKQLSQIEITDAGRGIYSHKLGDQWLTGGASNTGGNVLSYYFNNTEIQYLSEQMNPDVDTGLNYYPLLIPGERFPINNPNLSPRLQPRPDSDVLFLQGLMEGIAQIEADGYAALKLLGTAPIQQVITAGGGAINLVWSQIRARILSVPVIQASHTEAAYGTALLAKNGINI